VRALHRSQVLGTSKRATPSLSGERPYPGQLVQKSSRLCNPETYLLQPDVHFWLLHGTTTEQDITCVPLVLFDKSDLSTAGVGVVI